MTILDAAPDAALPEPLTGFVGRERELAALEALASRTRLLTLTGAGGSGKSRLALELAMRRQHAAPREEGAVAWVELSSLTDARALATHLALALGIRPEGAASAEQALLARLHDRALLLVLDNAEHVLDEAARLATLLLQRCSRLSILVTSREALGVTGERSWLVPGLSLPDGEAAAEPAAAASTEAVRLFVERARDVNAGFEVTAANVADVVRICRRLDGLPLAIELAAARANVLAPAQLADRLDNRFALLTSGARTAVPRHRTLRAALDWSHDLLPERERLLLERLSVFAGSFTLDAAEQVCADDGMPPREVLVALASLVTRSWVAMQEDAGQARYRLLETIRDYARERRAARGDATGDADDIGRRHAGFHLALAREAEPHLILGRSDRLAQMDAARDDLRAAFAWSAAHGEGARIGVPLAWALLWYWFHRQLWREGFREVEAALASAPGIDARHRAAALHGLGVFGLYIGDANARANLGQADALWREVGDRRWLAFTLLVRTVEASLRGAPEEARRLADEAVAVASTQPEPWDRALAITHALVPVLAWEGKFAEAAERLRETERIYGERGYAIGVAYVLDARAYLCLELGDVDAAARLAVRSLRSDPRPESRWLAGRSLRTLAAVAHARGDLARAATLFAAAAAMYEAIGAKALTAERRRVAATEAAVRAPMPEEAMAALDTRARAMTFAEAVEIALTGDEPPSAPTEPAAPVAAASVVDAPHSRARIAVQALGDLRITRDGVEIPADAWRYAKPRELFLYLLANPDGCTREQVGLAFWPDISAAQVKNNFHVTLHHLRHALGDAEWIQYAKGRYRVAAEDGVDFDAMTFERAAREAMRRLRAEPANAGAAVELADAVALYRGPFLEHEAVGDWHLDLRDRLARLHEQALLALGAHHDAVGAHAAAVDAYRRLLAADPLHEDAVRRVMAALARDGRRADALKSFERYAEAALQELEATPERATLQLAERIRNGSAP